MVQNNGCGWNYCVKMSKEKITSQVKILDQVQTKEMTIQLEDQTIHLNYNLKFIKTMLQIQVVIIICKIILGYNIRHIILNHSCIVNYSNIFLYQQELYSPKKIFLKLFAQGIGNFNHQKTTTSDTVANKGAGSSFFHKS